MRIVFHQQAVFESARLHFVSVDDEVAWTTIGLWNEAPFEAGIETCTTTTTESGVLYQFHQVAWFEGQSLRYALVSTSCLVLREIECGAADFNILGKGFVRQCHRESL